ncbi:hypothetical protein [Kribbella sp. NPDC055071]
MNEVGFSMSLEERRRLVEANASAAGFYRGQLLQRSSGWPIEYLRESGIEQVLRQDSAWGVGYAPASGTELVQHLESEGFSYPTMVRAGLVTWSEDAVPIDLHRDRLVMVARDHRLSPVGFIGMGRGGVARPLTPATPIHRQSNVLAGIEEQRDLLGAGATPVIVDEPFDAIALSMVSRSMNGEWAGVPVCGAGLSTAQARMLRGFSATDKVIVAISGNQAERHQAAGYLLDLAFFFDRVRAVELPVAPATLVQWEGGTNGLHDVLSRAKPLMTYRTTGAGFLSTRAADPDPPDQTPGI